MDEITRLKAQLAEEQRRREEGERRREETERRLEEAERRRDEAERLASRARSQKLEEYLSSCHQICIQTRPITEPTLGTGGAITDPTHRMYPSHIRVWDDFSTQQSRVWDSLSNFESFWSAPDLPSLHAQDHIIKLLEPVDSEIALMYNQFLTTQAMVKDIFSLKNTHVANEGHVSFEGHQPFQISREEDSLSHAMQHLSTDEVPERYRRNRRADQLCVWREEQGGGVRPVLAIEYKAPHKLTVSMAAAGLASDIRPETDIIDVFEDSTEFRSKNIMAAVVTQLFSYMIDIGVRHGYITTGEIYVFMHIPDEPGTVYCSINIPKDDCANDRDNWNQRTAVAQVFAFVQQALVAEPPSQEWIAEARSTLKRWKVEFFDILATIPETERLSRDHSSYKPRRWVKTRSLPFSLRNRCVPPEMDDDEHTSSDESGGNDNPSPLKRYRTRSLARSKEADRNQSDAHRSEGASGSRRRPGHTPIQNRLYCTQKCLIGLAEGRDIDRACPNVALHGTKHLSKHQFLRQLRKQLAKDQGSDADCRPMYIHGARGAMLKVCLTSHGYTLVAKGMSEEDHSHLVNEDMVYRRLCHLQGKHIPACLGILSLQIPYYYQAVDLSHLLLMGYGGRSLASQILQGAKPAIEPLTQRCTEALTAIHACGVYHRDAEPRNILYDPASDTLLFIDFERSRMAERKVLGELAPNRKRKPSSTGKSRRKVRFTGQESNIKASVLAEEVASMGSSISRALS